MGGVATKLFCEQHSINSLIGYFQYDNFPGLNWEQNIGLQDLRHRKIFFFVVRKNPEKQKPAKSL